MTRNLYNCLQGDMCLVEIPELEFSTGMTSTTGKFTTVEGLVDDIITEVRYLYIHLLCVIFHLMLKQCNVDARVILCEDFSF